MRYFISRILSLTGLTRSVDHTARKTIKTSLARNSVRQELEYGRLYRILLWGGHSPLLFALSVGAVCALITWGVGPHPSVEWPGLPAPPFPDDYDHANFFGTPWTVQATLVALVYPLVISFIAILLQRRATAKVALSVYLLDSAILPAGSSSIVLVAVMTVEYFVSPYLGTEWALPGMVFHGLWFVANIGLTGYFLARTIRFIQDEAGQEAYIRIAVNSVLREQLVTSLKEQLIRVEGGRLNWNSSISGKAHTGPQVAFMSLGRGRKEVKRNLNGSHELIDVHLACLGWVANRWLERANNHTDFTRARLCFPVGVSEVAAGLTVLCEIENGPPLLRIEQLMVQAAFTFRRKPQRVIAATTKAMLAELATEVHSLAEQHRYSASIEALRGMVRMHSILLASCEEKDESGLNNAATLAETAGWSTQTHHGEWLATYHPISTMAVRLLEQEQTLFAQVARIPNSLIYAVPSQPCELLIETLSMWRYLAYQMAVWWSTQRQLRPMPDGQLPEPFASVYQKALISFVGAWSNFSVEILSAESAENKRWRSLCNRATTYTAHIDGSARLMLDAIRRGDEVASIWFGDQFLKWWGNKQYELDRVDAFEWSDFKDIRISLAQHDWPAAAKILEAASNAPIDITAASQVLSYSIRRYWESMRVSLAAYLLTEEGTNPLNGPLRRRIVKHLIKGQQLGPGSNVEADSLENSTDLLRAVLDLCFTDEYVTGRLDSFYESLRWDEDRQMVPGWSYGGTRERTDVQSFIDAYVQLLLAVPGQLSDDRLLEKIVGWATDVSKLSNVREFAAKMHRTFAKKAGSPTLVKGAILRDELEHGPLTNKHRRLVAISLSVVRRTALRERVAQLQSYKVSEVLLHKLTRQLAELAFTDEKEAARAYQFCRVTPSPQSPNSRQVSLTHRFTKEELRAQSPGKVDEAYLRHIAHEVRTWTVEHAIGMKLSRSNFGPVTAVDDYSLLQWVATRCAVLTAGGTTPVVLVPAGIAARPFRAYNWAGPGSISLPPDIELTHGRMLEGVRVDMFINGAPVIFFSTPGGGCYVVPWETIKHANVLTQNCRDALDVSYAVTGSNEVKVTWQWRVG